MKEVLSEIFKELNLSTRELNYLSKVFKKETFEKGEIVLNSTEKVSHQYYVLTGCLRTFFVDPNNKEHTVQFAVDDWWITDYISYFLNEESVLTVEAIEKSTLLRIEKEDFERVFDKIPKIERFVRVKLERSLGSFQKRTLAALSQTAKQRYLSFVARYPNIEELVKNYHIASYLGITTQSLSRIRKEILIEQQ